MQTIRDFSLGDDNPAFIDRLERLYAAEHGPLGLAGANTIAAVRRLRELAPRTTPPAHGAVYPDSNFGRGLREIASLVKADVGLVASTIDLGGWDTHFVQGRLIERSDAGSCGRSRRLPGRISARGERPWTWS